MRAKRVQVDYLVVYSLSRVSRVDSTSRDEDKQVQSAEDAARIRAVLRIAGTKLIDESGIKDPNTMAFEVEMMVGNAQHETIMRTTRAGKTSRLGRGQAAFGGKPPFGWARQLRNGRDRKDGYELVPHPKEVEVLHRILRWFVEGGLSHTVRMLAKHKIPTTRGHATWARNTVRKIIDKAGSYHHGVIEGVYNGRPYRIEAPSLISADLAAKVAAYRQDTTHDAGAVFLSSGYMRCAKCRGTVQNHRSLTRNYTRCDRCKLSVRTDLFDRRLADAISTRLIQIAIHARTTKKKQDDHTASLAAVDTKIADVVSRMSKLWKAYESGHLAQEVWVTRNDELKAEKLAYEMERTRVQADADEVRRRESTERGLLGRIEEIIDESMDATLERRREILADLLGGQRLTVAYERDPEGKIHAIVTLPAFGDLASMTYRTDARVAPQVWGKSERRHPLWSKVLDKVITHRLGEALERLYASV